MVNVALSVPLILKMGVAGTVLATALSQVLVTFMPLLRALRKRMKISAGGYWRAIFQPWAPALPVLVAGAIAVLVGPDSPTIRLAVGAIAGSTALLLGWRRAWAPVPAT